MLKSFLVKQKGERKGKLHKTWCSTSKWWAENEKVEVLSLIAPFKKDGADFKKDAVRADWGA